MGFHASTSSLLSFLIWFVLLVFFLICIFKCLKISGVFVGPDHFKVSATKYFYIRCTGFIVHSRHSRDNNLLQDLYGRRLNKSFVNSFKVVNISHLRGLCHTLSMLESLPPIVSNGIYCIVCQSTEHQEACYRGSSSSLTGITVYYYDILYILYNFRRQLLLLRNKNIS